MVRPGAERGAHRVSPTAPPRDGQRVGRTLRLWTGRPIGSPSIGLVLPDEVSWYEATPALSLRLVRRAIDAGARSVIDIGGGASRLVDHLVDLRCRASPYSTYRAALSRSRRPVSATRPKASSGSSGTWPRCTISGPSTCGMYRAVFHFLTKRSEQDAYVALCERSVIREALRSGDVCARWSGDVQRPPRCSLRCGGSRRALRIQVQVDRVRAVHPHDTSRCQSIVHVRGLPSRERRALPSGRRRLTGAERDRR